MRNPSHMATAQSRTEQMPSGQILLEGELLVPVGAYRQLRCEKEFRIIPGRRTF
jgi:hypothetical protein